MKNTERVVRFLKDTGTYYLATIDGDKPRVRPFGTVNLFEDKVYIQTGKSKEVSRQISENPNVEICAFNGGVWLRIQCKLINDERVEAKRDLLDHYPDLKKMYDAEDDNTQVFYMSEAEATFSSFTDMPMTLKF